MAAVASKAPMKIILPRNTAPSFLSGIISLFSPRASRQGSRGAGADRRPACEFDQILRRFDEDGDGKISPAELRKCMRAAGEELTAEEAWAAVEAMDTDGDGLLRVEDLARIAGGRGEAAEEDEEEEKGRSLKEAFRVYEWEGEGCITAASLRAALGRMGEMRTEEECGEMIRRFDVNGDGVLSFEEFRRMMIS
ncbi:Putative calcium-binding protein CML19 [Apostasia shenzhenica]|uniref:Calcium-binding protein CML19 n=1 Tax=Apostasia shenzhenica TaxID=1088818 RepID=A0A2I0A6D6_9ASPA|nr:Putative calcium-binding protein CML19 [Apostasia shenzhenica]